MMKSRMLALFQRVIRASLPMCVALVLLAWPQFSSVKTAFAAGGPLLTLAPTSGPVGTLITLSGSNWPANSSIVIVFIDPSRRIHASYLGTTLSVADGSWTFSTSIPNSITYRPGGDEGGNGPVAEVVGPGTYLFMAATRGAYSHPSYHFAPPAIFTVSSSSTSLAGIVAPPPHSPAASNIPPPSHPQRPGGVSPASSSPVAPSQIHIHSYIWLLPLLFFGAFWGIWKLSGRKRLPMTTRVMVLRTAVFMLTALLLLGFLPGSASKVQAGAVLFSDDFESTPIGSLSSQWTPILGTWSVQLDGTHVLKQTDTSTANVYEVTAGSTSWTDYSAQSSIKFGSTANPTTFAFRRQDANNNYQFIFKLGNQWYLGKKVNGTWIQLASGSFTYNTTTFYTWQVTASGGTISASMNGSLLASVSDPGGFKSGSISFRTRDQSEFDNVVVTDLSGGTPTATPTPAPTVTPTATPVPTFGTISGQIVDAVTAAPISGAQVSTSIGGYSATTDANGNYSMASVATGTYNLTASSPEYSTTSISGIVVSANATTIQNFSLSPLGPTSAVDTFVRPNQSGWGTSSDGHIWQDDLSRYPAAVPSINNNQGFVDTYTGATDLDEAMGNTYTDTETTSDFLVTQIGQDAYLHGPRILGRYSDTHHYIDFAINMTNNTLALWVNNNEGWTQLSLVNSFAFQLNVVYHTKLRVQGTHISAKVWVAGTPEPNWQVTGTQSILNTGAVSALRTTYSNTYWTNYQERAISTISGRVVTTSGTAVAGATVSTSSGGYSAVTDSNGNYALTDILPGTYTVTVTATGHPTISQTVTVGVGATTTQNFTVS